MLKLLSAGWRLLLFQRRLRKRPAENTSYHILTIIGGLTLLWAKIEAQIDHINELAFFNGAKGEIESEIPRGLERKLRFLRKSHKRLPWLAELASKADHLAARLAAVAIDRHHLVHGVSQNVDAIDENYIFVRNTHGPLGLGEIEKTYSLEDFEKLAKAMVGIHQALLDHREAVSLAFIRDREGNIQA